MASRTLLLLHGINDDGSARGWVEGLDHGLARSGASSVADRGYDVVSPSYADLLTGDAPEHAPAPRYAYRRPADVVEQTLQARRYWRDLADLERALAPVPRPGPGVLGAVPADALASQLIGRVAAQAEAFRQSETRRHAIVQRVLDALPTEGRLTVVAHSLGSVVWADLLYCLPPDLHVDLVVTAGSPLSLKALQRHLHRLREDFPFSRVGAWVNVAGSFDPVTGFRGLAPQFPEVLDVFVDNGYLVAGHGAARYLDQDVVAAALRWVDRHEVGEAGTDLATRPSAALVSVLAGAQYALRLEQSMPRGERRSRFASARALVADEVAASFRSNGQDTGWLGLLTQDNMELLRADYDQERALGLLLTAWPSNPVLPYEIVVSDKVRRGALANLALDLGCPKRWAVVVEEAYEAAAGAHDGVAPVRVAALVAGVAALVAAPMLVLAMAPATLSGGAALVAGLSALGPGGMLGGLAVVGAVGGVGGGVAAAGLTAGNAVAVQQNVVLLQALAHARRALQQTAPGHPEWQVLTAMESHLATEHQRLKRFSDGSAAVLKELDRKLRHVRTALAWSARNGLGPAELSGAEAPSSASTVDR